MNHPGRFGSRSRAYIAWGVVCLVWGTTYLAIRIAIESLPPLLMAGLRWIIAGTLLVGFFRLRGFRLPGRQTWASLAMRGILFVALGNGAVVWAELTVPSGLTAVFVAASPFWMVAIDASAGDRRWPAFRQWLGLGIGFTGIVLLVSPQLADDINDGAFLRGFVATQLACAGWALGSIYARSRARANPAVPTLTEPACEMLMGGLVLTACGLLAGEQPNNTDMTARSLAAFVYLIVFGSIVGFSSYRYALQHLPVATVSLYVYVNTVIAVVLGTLVLDEPFSWRMGIGAAVVLLGIRLVKESDG